MKAAGWEFSVKVNSNRWTLSLCILRSRVVVNASGLQYGRAGV
jgi:hypothetical protein